MSPPTRARDVAVFGAVWCRMGRSYPRHDLNRQGCYQQKMGYVLCTMYNEWNTRWLKIMTLRQKDGSGTHTHTRGDGANDSSRENHQESKKHPQDSTRQNLLIWRFPKIGVPPVLIHFSGIFHEINHPASYWGTPIPGSTTRFYARHVTGLNIDKEQIRQERRPAKIRMDARHVSWISKHIHNFVRDFRKCIHCPNIINYL